MYRLFILALLFASCKTPVQDCSVWKPYVDAAGATVAVTLSCSNSEAVQADLYDYFQKTAKCGDTVATGPIAAMVCPIVVPFVQSFSASKLPAAWGCSLETPAMFTTKACEMIPW